MRFKKAFALFLLIAVLPIFAACGTITTKDAGEYSDDVDAYQTEPVPEGKPSPVNTEDQEIDKTKAGTCTLSVECKTILDNMTKLKKEKKDIVPEDGIIFPKQEVTFYEGESVFDVLQREMQDNKIHLEFEWTPLYGSSYVEGIANLYEMDCGELSGWTFSVNGWFPNYGASRYIVSEGDDIQWLYTCDLGKDVGSTMEE